jgi:type I restriction enzyme, S subunit
MRAKMNKPLNKIEKLITELCPEGVAFKELGEVIKLLRRTAITEKETIAGDFPVVAKCT